MQTNRNIIFRTVRDANLRFYQSVLRNKPYLNLDKFFPEYKKLEKSSEIIKQEILQIIDDTDTLPQFHEIDDGQSYISDNDGKSWGLFNVKLYGIWHKKNMKKCPETVSILKNMQNVKSIYFSVLAPGKHIPPHRGPYKGIFRYQLALCVPNEGNCELLVDGKSYHWKEGKSVLFDDSYVHEVRNETNKPRIALLLDIRRKEINGLLYYYDLIIFRLIQLLILFNGTFKKSTT